MKYICILILATALDCRGCERSMYTLRSMTITKGKDIGNNTSIKTAIDDVQKSFANARLSPKLNPFRPGHMDS
ncbi:hypothetical protein GCK32_013090 [Trichostrongylus colubriformis]|uniref:Uncharacterized protein n=1 Tax=Trichostrongylus colubriformis TaxID=6319 RepID=A0AAN8IV70_TRICO